MINGFFSVVQQDIKVLRDYLSQAQPSETKERANLIALRILAALGMAIACVFGVRTFAASTLIGAILQIAAAVASYAAFHDIFIMTQNAEKNFVSQLQAVSHGIWDDFKNFWLGNKTVDDIPHYPLTEGTFYRPFWDVVLNGLQE
jgi:hypothetical protein